MTIINTSHFKHLQHYRGTSIEDQPTHADMGDIFHLFTEDNDVIDYIFNGETWQLYTDKVDIGFEKVNKRIDNLGGSLAFLEDDAPTREEFDELAGKVSQIKIKIAAV